MWNSMLIKNFKYEHQSMVQNNNIASQGGLLAVFCGIVPQFWCHFLNVFAQ